MKLDTPLLVGWEYASEERFAKRTALFHELLVSTAHLAPLMPEIAEPFHATTRHVIFIAEKAG